MTDGTSARELYLAELRADREKIDQLIAMIEGQGGPTGGGNGGGAPKGGSTDSPQIGRHEFVGMSTPEATKRYLRKIGQRLASPRDIAAALIQGGQSTSDAEMVYQNVYSALKRMRVNDEVVKQGQEWGLAEVFPALAKRKKAKVETGTDKGEPLEPSEEEESDETAA